MLAPVEAPAASDTEAVPSLCAGVTTYNAIDDKTVLIVK